jgi:hypothetical protein
VDVTHNSFFDSNPLFYGSNGPDFEYSGVGVFAGGLNVYSYQLENFKEKGLSNKKSYIPVFKKHLF